MMYFRNYRLRKTYFNNYLKNPVLEDTSPSGMVNGNKIFWNLDERTFRIVIDQWEGNKAGKNLSYWYAKL